MKSKLPTARCSELHLEGADAFRTEYAPSETPLAKQQKRTATDSQTGRVEERMGLRLSDDDCLDLSLYLSVLTAVAQDRKNVRFALDPDLAQKPIDISRV